MREISQTNQHIINERIQKIMEENSVIDNNYIHNQIVAPIGMSIEQHYESLKIVEIPVGDILYKDIDIYSNGLF